MRILAHQRQASHALQRRAALEIVREQAGGTHGVVVEGGGLRGDTSGQRRTVESQTSASDKPALDRTLRDELIPSP